MLQSLRQLTVSFWPVLLREQKNPAVPQIMQGLLAGRIRTMAHHARGIFQLGNFPTWVTTGNLEARTLPKKTNPRALLLGIGIIY